MYVCTVERDSDNTEYKTESKCSELEKEKAKRYSGGKGESDKKPLISSDC